MWCIYASLNWATMGSNNGLLPDWNQAIIWTNAGLLSIRPFVTHFSEIRIKTQQFSFKKMSFKILSAKWWPLRLGLIEFMFPPWLMLASYIMTDGHIYVYYEPLSTRTDQPGDFPSSLLPHYNGISHWVFILMSPVGILVATNEVSHDRQRGDT